MTRQEEWETQEAITEKLLAPKPASQPTGRHKRNTRDRGDYNGYTKTKVVKLIEKKKGYVYSEAEKCAMTAYIDERLANMGLSASRGTPDWLVFDSGATARHAVEIDIQCGSIECRPEKWV